MPKWMISGYELLGWLEVSRSNWSMRIEQGFIAGFVTMEPACVRRVWNFDKRKKRERESEKNKKTTIFQYDQFIKRRDVNRGTSILPFKSRTVSCHSSELMFCKLSKSCSQINGLLLSIRYFRTWHIDNISQQLLSRWMEKTNIIEKYLYFSHPFRRVGLESSLTR